LIEFVFLQAKVMLASMQIRSSQNWCGHSFDKSYSI